MSTPMFQQFHALKAEHPDAILFFRMGDFYETFFGDAEVAAEVLEVALTSRNKNDPDPVPMAGVPHHAAAGYIQKLVDAGYRVAIAEQVEDPATATGLVRREVVRVVTPGVVYDTAGLEARVPNYLIAIGRVEDRWGLAALDASTADFRVTDLASVQEVAAEIHRLEPREALIAAAADAGAIRVALERHRAVISPSGDLPWDEASAIRALGALGDGLAGAARSAAAAALEYARITSGTKVENVRSVERYDVVGFVQLDDTTRRNLELTRTLLGGARRGSLIGLIDRTATPMGSRLLREWLATPLLSVDAIQGRSAAIGALVEDTLARDGLRKALREVSDVERINARVAQGSAHARDLAALRRSLAAVPEVVARASALGPLAIHCPMDTCADVHDDLERTLVDDPPPALTEGGLIRRGVDADLDEVLRLTLEGVAVINEVEQREREATGIHSLKIKRNKVFGYFIEVTRAQDHKVPDRYIRKQTIANGERYITPELKELEEKVLGADERRKSLEYALFADLRDRVARSGTRLAALARQLAALDTLAALADVAVSHRWSAPRVHEEPRIRIRGGRHPVVEALLREERFVPNDVELDAETRQLIVLTGPNMSGKSTIMRQVALIVLLAQIGSWVPAEEAEIGLCDRIFTRVGASDDLTRGQSTFMVEMSETSAILHGATARSLVVLDEIGRGTSTYDGLSIAWAVAEDLVDRIGCRAMFATHYHELCDLADTRAGVINQSVAVSERGDRVLFLRRLKDGGASRSYGIQCARIAGLPDPVVARARELLTRFEKHAPRNDRRQLSLFGGVNPALAAAEDEAPAEEPDALREALAGLDVDEMSPRQALDALYTLKRLLDAES